MINNKKGISGIILTIIMIGLVLVAVGIVWYVVNNVLTEQTESIDYASKCNGLIFEVNVPDNSGDSFTMISRAMGSKGDAIDGFQVVWSAADGTTCPDEDIAENIATSYKATQDCGGVTDPTKAEVRIYFDTDDSENPYYCSTIFSSAE